MAYPLAVKKLLAHAPEPKWFLSNVKLRKQIRSIVYLSQEWKFEASLIGNWYLRWFAQPLATLYLVYIYTFCEENFYLSYKVFLNQILQILLPGSLYF